MMAGKTHFAALPRRPGLGHHALLGAALAACLALTAPGRAAGDFPPPLNPAPQGRDGGAGPAAAEPASDTAGGPAEIAASPSSPAAPAPAATIRPSADVRIEQRYVGRRVDEVIVTPAGFTYQYSIVNLEGREFGSVLQPHPELSIPRFFRFDF
jgi:hypothetical protein